MYDSFDENENKEPETTPENDQNTNYGSEGEGQYRMKFDTGQPGESEYYTNPQTSANNQYANHYSYYDTTANQGTTPNWQKPPKKKNSFGKQMAKAACVAVVFGLLAGASFQGVNMIAKALSSDTETATVQTADTSDIDNSFTLNVVKTSSIDAPMIEATDVSDIVEEVKPAIVAVTTVVQQTVTDYFGRSYSQEGSGAGSGIIFSENDGLMYIVTNNHVIEGASTVSVTFNDGSSAEAIVKGYDATADIAVLTVEMSTLSEETKAAIKIAVLGDSDTIKEGNTAIAIGNALGYGQSTTIGCISSTAREVQLTDETMTLIQTDAAINPGNSGGALLNARGEVIGINTVKYSDTSVEGMGFAIPINSVIETVNDIISGKIVNKTDSDTAYLGIVGGTIDEATAQNYGCSVGVYVSNVMQNSAAARAGISSGYIITEFNGVTITTMEELQDLLSSCSPGDTVAITVNIPNDNNEYTEYQTLTTILGSAADYN